MSTPEAAAVAMAAAVLRRYGFHENDLGPALKAAILGDEKAMVELQRQRAQGKPAIDAVYAERNQLVAALGKMCLAAGMPVWIQTHQSVEGEEWDPEWCNVVFLELPTGQVSWHIHTSELKWFGWIEARNHKPWDGHTTEEKYLRLAELKP